jgi:hypothetical protein
MPVLFLQQARAILSNFSSGIIEIPRVLTTLERE